MYIHVEFNLNVGRRSMERVNYMVERLKNTLCGRKYVCDVVIDLKEEGQK